MEWGRGSSLHGLRALPRKKTKAKLTLNLPSLQKFSWRLAISILCNGLALFSFGCAIRVGPKTVTRDRFDYSSAIDMSWKEQMLLNLVRNRYLDPPFFMDVAQVVASYSFGGEAGINAPDWKGNPAGPAAGASGHWTESPTITYSPLVGDLFIKSLLKPISPSALFFLVQGGWPIDIVFGIAVKSINGLHAGSTIEIEKQAPDPSFYQVLKMMRELQKADAFALRVIEKGESQGTNLVFRSNHPVVEMTVNSVNVRKMLGLDQATHEFRLTLGAVPMDNKEIALLTRSMLEILGEAAGGVQIPDRDLDEGRATRRSLPKDVNEEVPQFTIHVHSADKKPPTEDTYAVVSYHGHWFWIDDRDLSSKRGLTFLLGLFTLAESGPVAPPPSLTIARP